MDAVSLFSGAGGFEIGLERAGIRTVLQAEIDPWCLSVLERHWPDVERVTDVRSVRKDDTPPLQRRAGDLVSPRRGTDPQWIRLSARGGIATGAADLVYGGFPCQDVSVAGNRAGLGGARSGLWSEFARVVRELRPRWVLVENVPGLLSSNRGRDFGTILSDLDELGYGVAWAILDARYFGVPQRRRRVFLVGCLGNPDAAAAVLAVCESGCGHPAKGSEERERVAASAYAIAQGTGVVTARPLSTSNERIDFETETFVVAGSQRASDGHHGHSSPRGDGGDNLIAFQATESFSSGLNENIAPPIRVAHGGGGRPAISNAAGVRRLTPLECTRLMGWPDGWLSYTADGKEIPDSHQYRMAGNGVVSTVAEWIGHRLVAVDRMLP